MAERVRRGGLSVAAELDELVRTRMLPGSGVEAEAFWTGFKEALAELGPSNRALLDKRAALQAQIDRWHLHRKGQPVDAAAYKAFLRKSAIWFRRRPISPSKPPMWMRKSPPWPARSSWCR